MGYNWNSAFPGSRPDSEGGGVQSRCPVWEKHNSYHAIYSSITPSFSIPFLSIHLPVCVQSTSASGVVDMRPPYNVSHEICQYPSYYYVPRYFPKYHASLIETEESVCLWLLRGLQVLFLACFLCSPLQVPFPNFDDNVCYIPRFLMSTSNSAYVECSSFSFCCLHRPINLKITVHMCKSRSVGNGCWICPCWST